MNRFNYDAMADILLPRAVGYSAGFLDAFFGGALHASFEGREMTIFVYPETMVGTFELRYERTEDRARNWPVGAPVQPEEPSQRSRRPAPRMLCQERPVGSSSVVSSDRNPAAVVGGQVGCPFTPPPPPPPGQWYVYVCGTFFR